MPRVFKPKPEMQPTESKELAVGLWKEKAGGKTSSRDVGVTLVEEPPVHLQARSCSQSQVQSEMNSKPAVNDKRLDSLPRLGEVEDGLWKTRRSGNCIVRRTFYC